MYSRANYTIVGIFVLLFGIGMVWFAFWLAKYGSYREFDTYKIEMTESVSGLSKDSVVKLHGVDVGRVSAININPKNIENIEILLEIKRGVPIKEDMVAYTQMLGVTGLLSIEIDGGTNRAKTLEPTEEYIPIIPAAPSWMSKATKGIGNLSDKITLLIDQSQKLLTDANIKKLEKILDNIEKATAKGSELEQKIIGSLDEANKTAVEFRNSMNSLTNRFESLSDDISRELKSTTASLSDLKNTASPVLKKLMSTTKNFNRVTLRVEKTLRRGDYNLKKIFEPVLVDIEIMGNQINDLVQQIEKSPNDILFKSRKSRRGPGE
jgi:phospholipid/cholesterol/gamma-HCH transport system substrate-binding protein